MRTPLALLKFVGKALLNAVGAGVLGEVAEFLFDVVPEMAQDVWEWWGAGRDEGQKQAELEALAQAPQEAIRAAVAQVVHELAADQPPPVREVLVVYLTQVAGTVRQSLRRGVTPAPAGSRRAARRLPLRQAEDLLPLLPLRLPRFKPGDRPLPGVDWELLELLGIGGFGEVWKARNPHFDGVPFVALKFCLHAESAALLRHEAAVLNRVMRHGRHRGIVPLLHTYLDAEPPCLAYEYVEGGDLASLIREWHQPWGLPEEEVVPESVRLIAQLAEIVAHAHRLEPPIVHRDLKPANVLVQRSAEGDLVLRVADFGIGGLAASQALEHSSRNTGRAQILLTALRGAHTPLYASPQQVRGAPPDPRDDVYALGVIWYQLLTGDLTTGRPGGTRWVRRLGEQGLAPPLVDLLGSCFEDQPDDRPADAGVLAGALHSPPAPARTCASPSTLPPPPHRIGIQRRLQVDGPVESVTFARDGRQALAGTADGNLRLWDLESGLEKCRFEGSNRWVLSVAFAPNGQRVLSGSWDRRVRLWDVATGYELRRYEGHRGRVLAVGFAAGARRFYSCGSDRVVRLCELDSGAEVHGFQGHGDLEWGVVAVSADARRVLSGSADTTVRLWDVPGGQQLRLFEGHARPVLSVALAPDGRRALSGGWDHDIRVWDVKTGREVRRLEGHTDWVWSLSFTPDGGRALSGGADGTVRLWDLETGREVLRFEGHGKAVHSVAVALDGRRALSGGADGTVRLWGLPE